MGASRRLLYWGLLFIALGGVLALVEMGVIDEGALLEAVRLWPLVVIALGVAIVVRRSRYGLPAWLVAATASGLLLGGSIATGPRVGLDCTDRDRPVLSSQAGAFGGPATVDVSAGCGSLAVTSEPGAAWRVEAGDAGRATATVSSSASALKVDAGTTGSWSVGSAGSTTWRLTLPTTPIDDLRLALSAGDGRVSLVDARITKLSIAGRATELRVDLSRTSLTRLDASVSIGGLWIRLPDTDLTGTLDVSVGEIKVCLPADVGLQVRRASELGVITYEGFEQHLPEWHSPGYEQAPYHVDLTVSPNLGGIEFNPIGGCA